MVENLPANAVDTGDAGSIPALGRSPKGRKATDRGAWRATVHRITKNQMELNMRQEQIY